MNARPSARAASLLFAAIAAIAIAAGAPPAGGPQAVEYDKPVTLTGTITREYDMSFVDSDQGPLSDPKEVARVVAQARKEHPVDNSRPHDPIPHYILHLDKPITVPEGAHDDLHPEERNVSEIDLDGTTTVPVDALGKGKFVVTGKLWHAETVHHLRPIEMTVSSLKPAGGGK